MEEKPYHAYSQPNKKLLIFIFNLKKDFPCDTMYSSLCQEVIFVNGFTEVKSNIYHLVPDSAEFGSAVTLVTGKNNFLINCGARDSSVTNVIVPALKALGLTPKDIDYVVFTHCSPETVGGLHRLKRLAPEIHVLASEAQVQKIINPTYYVSELCSVFPDHAPPFREIKGVLVDARINPDDIIFKELRPFSPTKSETEHLCWYHVETGFLVCGDMVQGDGTAETGTAFFRDLKEYRNILKYLSTLQISGMLLSHNYRDAKAITVNHTLDTEISGEAEPKNECIEAIDNSLEHIKRYGVLVDEFIKLCRKKHEQPSVEKFTVDYFANKPTPLTLGYAMLTFNEFF